MNKKGQLRKKFLDFQCAVADVVLSQKKGVVEKMCVLSEMLHYTVNFVFRDSNESNLTVAKPKIVIKTSKKITVAESYNADVSAYEKIRLVN